MSVLLREAESIICAIIFMVMTLLGFANVVVRYATSYSLASTEEILINGFLLLTIFGAAIAARRGEHLAVTLFCDLLPLKSRKVILIISTLLSVTLLALSAWFVWGMVASQIANGMRSYALQIPVWYYNIGVPFGLLLVLVRYVQYAVQLWQESGKGEPKHV